MQCMYNTRHVSMNATGVYFSAGTRNMYMTDIYYPQPSRPCFKMYANVGVTYKSSSSL